MGADSGRLGRRRFLVGAASVVGLAGLTGLARADTATSTPAPVPAGPVDVRAFGATGNGATLDTAAIQAAVDSAAARGGGTVVIPPGRFLTGTVVVRSRVTLHLSPGATLLGSTDIADYPPHPFPARDLDLGGYQVWALLYAEGAEQIAVEGGGVIDGQGWAYPKVPIENSERAIHPRPRMIFFKNCRDVRLQDATLRESGMWTVHLALCDAVRVSGLRVESSFFINQDGIVLDSCRDATVERCSVSTVDDAVVLKSSFPRACSDIRVSGCDLQSFCAGLKLGTQSLGGFHDIDVRDCTFHDCRLGGLKFQTVDGGDLERVAVENVTMRNVAAPLSFRRGDRGFDYGFRDVARPRPVGRLRGVSIRGLRATVTPGAAFRTGQTMSIAGLPGFPVEDVTLEDLAITFPGGGTPADAARPGIPELANAYPEHTMFGVLPAYGLWMRHAARITLRDVHLDLAAPDARPALVSDDVAGLELTGVSPPGAVPGPG